MTVSSKKYAFSFPSFGGANIFAPPGMVITDMKVTASRGQVYLSLERPWRLINASRPSDDAFRVQASDSRWVTTHYLRARRIGLRAYKYAAACTVEIIIAEETAGVSDKGEESCPA